MHPESKLKQTRCIFYFIDMKIKLFITSKQGFTLIEVLVVIIVVGILSAIAAPSWLTFTEVRRLNTAQNQVYRSVREAQSNAKREKLTWQASFREQNNVVQWAVHPITVTPANASWNNLDSHVRLDAETTLQTSNGARRIEFDYRGSVNRPPLGRITLSSRNGGKAKRCVIISTILGAIRTAKERPTPNNEGKYCY